MVFTMMSMAQRISRTREVRRDNEERAAHAGPSGSQNAGILHVKLTQKIYVKHTNFIVIIVTSPALTQ